MFGTSAKNQSNKKERMMTLLNAGSRTVKSDLLTKNAYNNTYDDRENHSVEKRSVGNLIGTFDDRKVNQLSSSFYNNFKHYNP